MAKRNKSFNAMMSVLLILGFVIALLFVTSIQWMFTSIQLDIAIMAILLVGAALFVFQIK